MFRRFIYSAPFQAIPHQMRERDFLAQVLHDQLPDPLGRLSFHLEKVREDVHGKFRISTAKPGSFEKAGSVPVSRKTVVDMA
ncbi:MAG: hypothetical protein QHH75_10870 [Bacillota bacterium]|nr:hypothetical protein [Bacillota bacterium]